MERNSSSEDKQISLADLAVKNERKIQELRRDLENFDGVIHDEETDAKIQELNDRLSDEKDYEAESSIESLLGEEEQALGETAIRVAYVDLYGQNINRVAQRDLIARAEQQLSLDRNRTSYEAKQDVVIALKVMFSHYSREGSYLGAQAWGIELEGGRPTEKEAPYLVAESYLMNFLSVIKSKTDEHVYRDETGRYRKIEETIQNALGLKDVDWFGDEYEQKLFTDREVAGFRRRMEEVFATTEEHDPVLGTEIKSKSQVRNDYIKNLSRILADERREYNQSEREETQQT